MPNELAQAALEAVVTHQERRSDDVIALGTNGNADGVIVGEYVGESPKAADPVEGRSAQCDGGAETRLPTEEDRGDCVRQELRVDGERG